MATWVHSSLGNGGRISIAVRLKDRDRPYRVKRGVAFGTEASRYSSHFTFYRLRPAVFVAQPARGDLLFSLRVDHVVSGYGTCPGLAAWH